MRMGRTAGILVPMRTNSMCLILRRRVSSQSSFSSPIDSGSPPESSTSRTSVCCLEVGERLFPLRGREIVLAARIADHARARAIAAIGRAEAGGEEQNAIGIAMDEARGDRVVVFAQGVVLFTGQADVFVRDHDVRAAERLRRVGVAHQARIIRCDADGQRAFVAQGGRALVLRQVEHAFELFERADAAARLPTPVVPVVGGRARDSCVCRTRALQQRRESDWLCGSSGRDRRREEEQTGVGGTRRGD